MAQEFAFTFPLPNGLHARPASSLCRAVSRFGSGIVFSNRRTGLSANGRSILALVATLTKHGDECSLRIDGEDEEAAAESLRRFITDDFPNCDEALPARPAPPPGGRVLPRVLREPSARVRAGFPASGGIARAPVLTVRGSGAYPDVDSQTKGTTAAELAKLQSALAVVETALRGRMNDTRNATQFAILGAHLSILSDPELRTRLEAEVRSGEVTAGRAALATADHFAAILRASESELLQERALDLEDLGAQIVRALYGPPVDARPADLREDAIVVAGALAPSQLIALEKGHLRGIVLAQGGRTSHTVILARALGIPCVTGVSGIERWLADGEDVVVDGERGLVVARPSPAVRRFYELEAGKLAAFKARAEAFRAARGTTKDGTRLEVAANVGSLAEARLAFEAGAEGIGLFRTELLFMDRAEPPSEDEQAQIYSETARAAAGRPVIVRTLDVGGDKPIPYLDLPHEHDPVLGCRAVRMYDDHPEIVEAQIRAILRASATGNVKLMFPMISSLEEIRTLRTLVRRFMGELASGGIAYNPRLEIGIMVEVPSAALTVDTLAREADFFSIGSNDLAQYVLAVDRGNEKVARLYNFLHPGFLRVLAQVTADARVAGKWVGLCGELGGSELAAPLLVGLGLDEISMSTPSLATMKAAVARCDTAECRDLVAAALASETAADVEALLRRFAAARHAGSLVAPEAVRLGSVSRTRAEAIREMVDLLHLAGRVDDPDAVEDAVWQREEVYSTGVGFGIAVPHCTSSAVLATSIAVAQFASAVDWDSLDGQPVEMAFLVAVDASAAGEEHLKTIAGLSRRLMDDEFRASLLAAGSAAEVVTLLRDAVVVP